ncbi:ribbon-helix-helix domain-containing protein [Candidatus Methanomethylophilus sp. 1R26]|uniref:ribbon-helix-helix domain-containing protein n=1 Tax=Candidatus Methanomethylophilus sp. 1R26 TaxID=1769296 RepID=UPI0012FEF26C|nr:ribbon-helix-helix domain-containing protein [Candidatus Methanomethylophilus sp. 1R26]WII08564.1 hypothetical protein O8W32_05170 [Methanomassiliicoccales archaeon LGM-DZ1]
MDGSMKLTARIPSDELVLMDSLVSSHRFASRSDFLLEAVSRLLAECLSPSERESILEAAAEAESHGIEEFSDGDPASELASAYRESLERKG